MIEVNEDVQLATNRREQEIHRSEEVYHRAVAEGRIVVKSRDGTTGRLVVQHNASVPSIPPRKPSETEAVEVQPVEAAPQPADPEAAWRHTRIALVAGLVILLLVVWIWQKRTGRS